ncbi:MAG: hypothetical protein QXU82_00905 [Candidatus Aenigmatarchaeota archaeon]
MIDNNLREMEAAKQVCDEAEKTIYKARSFGYSEGMIRRMAGLKKGDC